MLGTASRHDIPPSPHRYTGNHPKPLNRRPPSSHLISIPPLDPNDHVRHLRQLAGDFEGRRTRVRSVSCAPGTNALHRIRPLLLKAQDLTATAPVRLTALDNYAYTNIAGSRTSLECLASIEYASSLASNDLANALFANPYEGTPLVGYPADDETLRTARHTETIPRMTGHLEVAAHQLDLSAAGCHYFAIIEDLTSVEDHQAVAARNTAGPVTLAQYDALTSLQRGRRLYESSPRGLGIIHVADDDGTCGSTAAEWAPCQEELDDRAAVVREPEQGVVDGCSPWACRDEVEPMQDDFGLAS
ncbi:hypothetical protein OHN37_07500 [Streptomyces sp. NBC_00485]|uniref:hypothetical protein n=1 Tax=Streptomyces sp. NBC_00485 TaxID=2975758 RepID=UPI002E19E8F8